MAVRFQLVIDCADPDRLARFWAAALGYELQPPPSGFASWDAYWRAVGVPEADLGIGVDCIIDPEGGGPRIWFQVVPEPKTVKNRLHLDVQVSGGNERPRGQRIRHQLTTATPGVMSSPNGRVCTHDEQGAGIARGAGHCRV